MDFKLFGSCFPVFKEGMHTKDDGFGTIQSSVLFHVSESMIAE
jgi:hypothetical protein